MPQVSVVHAKGDNNPIADSVKNALEAEMEDYLKKNSNASDLPDLPEEPPASAGSDALPDSEESSGDEGLPNLPKEPPASAGSDALPDSEEPSGDESLPDLPKESAASADGGDLPDGGKNTEGESLPDLPEKSAAEPEIKPEAESEHGSETGAAAVASGQSQDAAESPKPAEPTEPPKPAESAESLEPQESERPPVAADNGQPGETQAAQPQEEQQAAAEPESKSETETAAEPETKPATETKPESEIEPEPEPSFTMINVMEYLVREQVPKYIEQFGHCKCSRCVEDTVALTLTHLPAKYVVVDRAAVSPLLNFYEKRYAGQVTVEITKATMRVQEVPHHNR